MKRRLIYEWENKEDLYCVHLLNPPPTEDVFTVSSNPRLHIHNQYMGIRASQRHRLYITSGLKELVIGVCAEKNIDPHDTTLIIDQSDFEFVLEKSMLYNRHRTRNTDVDVEDYFTKVDGLFKHLGNDAWSRADMDRKHIKEVIENA